MSTIAPDTVNFAAKALIIACVFFAGIVAPAAGIALFFRTAVRLGAPEIEKQLMASQTFMNAVAQIAEHKDRTLETRMLATWELMKRDLGEIREKLQDVPSMRTDLAYLRGRADQKEHDA